MSKLKLSDTQTKYLTQILDYLDKYHPDSTELHVVYSPEGVLIHTQNTFYQYFDKDGNNVPIERKKYEIPIVKYTIENILKEGEYGTTSREFLNNLKALYGAFRDAKRPKEAKVTFDFDYDPFKLVYPIITVPPAHNFVITAPLLS